MVYPFWSTAWTDGVAVAKADIRNGLRDYVPTIMTLSGLQGLTTQQAAYVLVLLGTNYAPTMYKYDASDTTTADDGGVTCIVSADGYRYKPQGNAVKIGTGTVAATAGTSTTLSGGTLREVLTAARTYYVRTDGSDSNTGLANTAGGAFLTIQKAVDVCSGIDMRGYAVEIVVADGTYTDVVAINKPWVGASTVQLTGNTTTPANCHISTTGSALIVGNTSGYSGGQGISLRGFKITSSSGDGIKAAHGAIVYINGNICFGGVGNGACMITGTGGKIFGSSFTMEISGNCNTVFQPSALSIINLSSMSLTLTGTPAWATSCAYVARGGQLVVHGLSTTGSATGKRYSVTGNGSIDTNGGGASYFPGSVAGTTTADAEYV
jgi:hypothetical protein